jgi:hypothetical protein
MVRFVVSVGAWHVYGRSFSGIDPVNGAREFLQGQVRVTRIDEHHVAFSSIKIAGVLANAHGNPHQRSSHK